MGFRAEGRSWLRAGDRLAGRFCAHGSSLGALWILSKGCSSHGGGIFGLRLLRLAGRAIPGPARRFFCRPCGTLVHSSGLTRDLRPGLSYAAAPRLEWAGLWRHTLAALREPAWSRSPSKPAKASAVGLASQIEPSLARPEGRMRPSLHVPCWVSAALSSAKLIEHLFSAAWAVRAFLPPRSLRTAAEIAEKGAHYIDSVRKNVTPE